MPEVRIAAEPRSEFGKGAARQVRREGRVPGVLYGHGTDTRHVSLPGHDLLLALRTPNVLILLDGLPGGSQLALPKAVQRDPIRGSIDHVDLILVRRGEKVTVDIPVQVSGEVAPDGMLDQQLIQIPVEAEATPARLRAEAANEPVFRWKLVAGAASLAAAAAIGWNWVGVADSRAAGAQLALQQAPPAIVATAEAPKPAVPNLAASRVMIGNGNPQVMLRDPRLDQLLEAHQQAGGASQMPSGFLRNATFDRPSR